MTSVAFARQATQAVVLEPALFLAGATFAAADEPPPDTAAPEPAATGLSSVPGIVGGRLCRIFPIPVKGGVGLGVSVTF